MVISSVKRDVKLFSTHLVVGLHHVLTHLETDLHDVMVSQGSCEKYLHFSEAVFPKFLFSRCTYFTLKKCRAHHRINMPQATLLSYFTCSPLLLQGDVFSKLFSTLHTNMQWHIDWKTLVDGNVSLQSIYQLFGALQSSQLYKNLVQRYGFVKSCLIFAHWHFLIVFFVQLSVFSFSTILSVTKKLCQGDHNL